MADSHDGSPSARRSNVVSATTNQRKVINPTLKTKDRNGAATVFDDRIIGEELRCCGGEGRLRARADVHRDKDQDCGGQPGDAGYPAEAPPSHSTRSRHSVGYECPL